MVQYLGAVTSGSMDTLAPKARGGLGSQTRRPRELPGEGSWTELGPLAMIEPQNRSWEQTYTQNFLSSLPPIFCTMKHEEARGKDSPCCGSESQPLQHRAGWRSWKSASEEEQTHVQFLNYIYTLVMGHIRAISMRRLNTCSHLNSFPATLPAKHLLKKNPWKHAGL